MVVEEEADEEKEEKDLENIQQICPTVAVLSNL